MEPGPIQASQGFLILLKSACLSLKILTIFLLGMIQVNLCFSKAKLTTQLFQAVAATKNIK